VNNFGEDMAAFLIGSIVFLVSFFKRHWRLTLAAFIVFLLWRHFIARVD